MGTDELPRTLCAIAGLLAAAHGFGRMAEQLRQPRVIGEIAGGLLAGPTVLGSLVPGVQQWLFPGNGPAGSVAGIT